MLLHLLRAVARRRRPSSTRRSARRTAEALAASSSSSGEKEVSPLDLERLRSELGAVLRAIRQSDQGIPKPPPAVLASCIIIGHTRRQEVEKLLGEPWRPKGGTAGRVAHYVYPPGGPATLASLFIEYDDGGLVRSISASCRADAADE